MGGDVVRLMQRFRIAGGERRDLLPIRLAVRSQNAGRKESQHLIERPGKMNRGALRENFRALTVAAEPEAEAAQQEVRVRRRRIAAVQGEPRQHARWLGEAAGFRDLPGLIRGRIGTPNASAPAEARASPWPQTGCRLQGVDNGCGRGNTAGKPAQDGTLGSNLGTLLLAQGKPGVFPEATMPCPILRRTCRWPSPDRNPFPRDRSSFPWFLADMPVISGESAFDPLADMARTPANVG